MEDKASKAPEASRDETMDPEKVPVNETEIYHKTRKSKKQRIEEARQKQELHEEQSRRTVMFSNVPFKATRHDLTSLLLKKQIKSSMVQALYFRAADIKLDEGKGVRKGKTTHYAVSSLTDLADDNPSATKVAFVRFKREEHADLLAARKTLKLFKRHMFLQSAVPSRAQLDATCTLFVGGLAPTTDPEQLFRLIRDASADDPASTKQREVTSLRLLREAGSRACRGVALVELATREQRDALLESGIELQLGDKPLRLWRYTCSKKLKKTSRYKKKEKMAEDARVKMRKERKAERMRTRRHKQASRTRRAERVIQKRRKGDTGKE
eukprot:gnl/Dysnectes_brevis/1397_a1573_2596.p1 GENE.gnl/Dysnectes_brevis/1397_a1573_2596~~gnl/Dysnectes_brevis/1397_a1573_2596.p1  ORF type:complete len:381 (+),score=130.20 gnl/Dysnectes_brevis/1397_a1573_2596:169-1143(+)